MEVTKMSMQRKKELEKVNVRERILTPLRNLLAECATACYYHNIIPEKSNYRQVVKVEGWLHTNV